MMGDLNAKAGSDNEGYESCMGREGVGDKWLEIMVIGMTMVGDLQICGWKIDW